MNKLNTKLYSCWGWVGVGRDMENNQWNSQSSRCEMQFHTDYTDCLSLNLFPGQKRQMDL